ncbi:alpha/beta hydrolase [Brachybacterium sp. MASK1Z-5]|uniref:Alpha/beta hydrolase n=1 Tax=Brachybacterium halotolerans TaxID=2795215 RepID=A0ABS1B598_9MICO|nr:alpha/beta hydrolase [Brachybacterium halotolerans]MBK0329809.1 alpha/beta hydrolase [Brachybacterium halotolerans]
MMRLTSLGSRDTRPEEAPDGHDAARELRRWGRALAIGGVGALGTFALSAGALAAGARLLARVPLTPQMSQRGKLVQVVRAAYPDRIHLDRTAESVRGGVIALRRSGGAVHVRLGPVDGEPTPTTVSRPILARDTDEPIGIGPVGLDGFFWPGTPETSLGLPTQEVEVSSPVGPMPAWLVPGRSGVPEEDRADADVDAGADAEGGAAGPTGDIWAVLTHGHGATRGETLRAMSLLHELGLTCLSLTYRNDLGSPASADRMHHLGLDEWEDTEAGIEYALAHGARRIVLMGWSMGGGITLRTSVRTAHPEAIAGLVLDSPAVDWQDILTYHATALRAPAPMRRLALWMMTSPLGARLVRLHEPLALAEMRAEHYAQHLRHRTLLVHALEDTTVPPAPSARLAALRPDLVRFVPFAGASHTREWNRDPEQYERLLAEHLVDLLDLDVDVEAMRLPVRDPAAAPLEGSIGARV